MNVHNRKIERNKEDVRKLSQKEGNRFCIDCGMRGPLYVVINFHIFVCSTCAALHRSLQHKVKGISMTEFTEEEVAGLRVGGNDRAEKVWLQKYKGTRPHHGNDAAVKNFIMSSFDSRAYLDHGAFNQLQEDLLRALHPDASQPPPPTAAQASTAMPHAPSALPQMQELPPPPSTPQPVPHADPFSQPAVLPPQAQTQGIPSGQDDDQFDAFFTAPAPSPPVGGNTAVTAHDAMTDLFASVPVSNMPPVSNTLGAFPMLEFSHFHNNQGQGFPNLQQPVQQVSAQQLPIQQQYPYQHHDQHQQQQQMFQQFPMQPQPMQQGGMHGYPGVNGGGYAHTPYGFPQQQQQQQQYPQQGFPSSGSTAPIVVLNKTQAGYGVNPVPYTGVPSNVNHVNFFEPSRTDTWFPSTVIQETVPQMQERPKEEQHDTAFASLDPFGSRR